MAEADARRNNMLKEKVVVLEFKINRLGIVGRAYYEASQIKLRRNRYLIRAARTRNMLLHSALLLLTQKEMAARKESSNLGGMRKQAMSLQKDFDDQRKKSIAKQLQLQAQITNTRSAEIDCADLLDPNTPPLLRIRYLDAKLEAIYKKNKDTQMVEKHYESLLKPMRTERTLYTFQLENITNIIDLKKGQIMQLQMVMFDGVKSRDQARKELEELLASLFPGGRIEGLSKVLQAKMKKAVGEIKIVMQVDSARAMYQEYLFQEKQCLYLIQIKQELETTLPQLKNEARIPHTHRRKSIARLQQVDVIVDTTKNKVRRLTVQQHRKNSFPLILLLEGTKKLVDKLHEGTAKFEGMTDDEVPERKVFEETEGKLVTLLKGIARKMNFLENLEKQQAKDDAELED